MIGVIRTQTLVLNYAITTSSRVKGESALRRILLAGRGSQHGRIALLDRLCGSVLGRAWADRAARLQLHGRQAVLVTVAVVGVVVGQVDVEHVRRGRIGPPGTAISRDSFRCTNRCGSSCGTFIRCNGAT